MMIRWAFRAAVVVLAILLARVVNADPSAAPPTDKAAIDQSELEKRFAETMSGATLVGRFSVNGRQTERPLKEERYSLGQVSKLSGDYWLIPARIQYGDHDLQLPLMLQVKWAGDTPVITLTDLAIPGLGTYTARVLIYDGAYAGTWSAGDHGGQLFGRVVHESKQKAEGDGSGPSK